MSLADPNLRVDAADPASVPAPAAVFRAVGRESGLLATASLEAQINNTLGDVYARLRARLDPEPLVRLLRGARIISRISGNASSSAVNLLDDRIGSALGLGIGAWIEELANTREGQKRRVIVGDANAHYAGFQDLLDAMTGDDPAQAILGAVEGAVHEILDAERWLFGRLQREFSRRWNDEIARELWPERNQDGNDLPRKLDPVLQELAQGLNRALQAQLDLGAIVDRACGAAVRQWAALLDATIAERAARSQAARAASQQVEALQGQVAALSAQVGHIDRQLNQALGLTFLALVGLGLSVIAGLWGYHVLSGRVEAASEAGRAELAASEARTKLVVDQLACAAGRLACNVDGGTDEAKQRCREGIPACAAP